MIFPTRIQSNQTLINFRNRKASQTIQDNNSISRVRQSKKIQRKKQSNIIYTLVILATLTSGFQTIVYFALYLSIPQIVFTMYCLTGIKLVIWIVSICQLTQIKQIKRLFLLIDPVFLTEIAVSTCTIYLFYILKCFTWFHYILYILIVLMNHLYSTNFRVMLLYCQWSKMQIIIYKLSLGIVCSYHVAFGAYYLQSYYSYTNRTDQDIDETIKSFILLFTMASVSFMFEMFAKFSDFDGTAELHSNYILKDGDQGQQLIQNK